MTEPVKVAVIYYSSTGNIHRLAEAVSTGAEKGGAEVRMRRVAELAPPEAIAGNPEWQANVDRTKDIPEAAQDDLEWADAVLFGTPTRYGTPAAQLKQFIDATGPLWQQGKLADKVYSVFVSTGTKHGGVESTVLSLSNIFYHWGGMIVPPGYTDPVQFELGNPYGAMHVSSTGAPGELELNSAHHQGRRSAEVAAALKAGR
ncbi:NAD(P)H:quinone oxidoreductase [Haloactinomyces albus]|uniref:NAD(P)H dehydrogenase (Quinone) n=1 Tax=Haloactinomyces albus TaxID=1352928 RepID=A0AAE3ZBR4_9ACTN|nr:NAD(P)H:quinone oxidoreductase [Haloactinomyces albus]MDR7301986.1 NAD(P)H dehydrogenase (quinone) [Haloactinomyces albus]